MLNIQRGPNELRFLCELFDGANVFHDAAEIVKVVHSVMCTIKPTTAVTWFACQITDYCVTLELKEVVVLVK